MKKIEEFHLYDWQKRCLGLWHENGCRGIISVATGAGKTMLAIAAANLLLKRSDVGGHDQVRRLNSLIAEGGRIGRLAERLKNLYLRRKKVLLLAASRVECGEELLKLLLPNQRIIVFTERIRTANALFERLNAYYPNRISRYHSHMDTVQKQIALDDYRSGRCSVLLCCRALDEGLNVPDTDVGILISSSNNQRQRIQRIGRIVRKTDANRPKRIYYLYVPNTVESPDILQADSRSVKAIDTVDLRFDSETGRILNAPYDCVAEKVLRKLSEDRATEKQFENAAFQLRKGAVALDYLMPEADCILRLKNASSGEKDYLSAMLLMIRATKP